MQINLEDWERIATARICVQDATSWRPKSVSCDPEFIAFLEGELRYGGRMLFVGGSNSGKTTLQMHLLTRLGIPSQLFIDGRHRTTSGWNCTGFTVTFEDELRVSPSAPQVDLASHYELKTCNHGLLVAERRPTHCAVASAEVLTEYWAGGKAGIVTSPEAASLSALTNFSQCYPGVAQHITHVVTIAIDPGDYLYRQWKLHRIKHFARRT